MFTGYPQAFLPPDALHALVIDAPAFDPQQSRDFLVSIPPVLRCQADDVSRQLRFVTRHLLRAAI